MFPGLYTLHETMIISPSRERTFLRYAFLISSIQPVSQAGSPGSRRESYLLRPLGARQEGRKETYQQPLAVAVSVLRVDEPSRDSLLCPACGGRQGTYSSTRALAIADHFPTCRAQNYERLPRYQLFLQLSHRRASSLASSDCGHLQGGLSGGKSKI